ncbi:MAG: PNGase F N-terminal domain-containing protein [Rikenellaceae bacterium]
MKKTILTILTFALCIGSLFAQSPKKVAKVTGVDVTYAPAERQKAKDDDKKEDKKDGKKGDKSEKARPTTLLQIRGKQSVIVSSGRDDDPDKIAKQLTSPPTVTYVDLADSTLMQVATLYDGRTVATESALKGTSDFQVIGEEYVAGWYCIHVRTSINSNTIDIWYTPNLGYNGSPMPSMGVPDGVVLKIARNGNVSLEALQVNQTIDNQQVAFGGDAQMMDQADFSNELRQSVVKTIEVFDHDRIGFSGAKGGDSFHGGELYTVAGGTVIMKKVALPSNPEDYSIFAEVVQYSDGDAYDRTGSIFIIPTDKKLSLLDALSTKGLSSVPSFVSGDNSYPAIISTDDYTVPAELMRFFTSFGVRKFNHIKVKGQVWADSVLYKQEVSHLTPMLKDSAWVAAYIGNWDAKGHILSLKLKYYPEASRKIAKSIPLFNTLNIMEQGGQTYPTFFATDSLRVSFNLDEPVKNGQLVYITTGHGGWGGGDEFNQRLNTIYLDGKKISSMIPWREDCATYRNWNPCSGNFSNGMSSSDLSRSNWCPGTVTYPFYIPLGDLEAGEHTLSVQIPLGEPEGNAFSYWCISGTLIGE